MTESRIEGGFYEQAEVDWKMERYEKLNIPPFIDSRRSTVVHDFKYVSEETNFFIIIHKIMRAHFCHMDALVNVLFSN